MVIGQHARSVPEALLCQETPLAHTDLTRLTTTMIEKVEKQLSVTSVCIGLEV